MTKILITGANGFIGSNLIKRFDLNKIQVIGVYRKKNNNISKLKDIRCVQCDLTNSKEVEFLFQDQQIDVVIHAAAIMGPPDSQNFMDKVFSNNVVAQKNLIKYAIRNSCKRFIFCSTISVYEGNPIYDKGFREDDCVKPDTLYGWSKYSSEELLRIQAIEGNIQGISLRIAGAHGFGRNSGVVFNMFKSVLQNKEIVVNEPDSCFRLAFIEDIIEGIYCAVKMKNDKPYCIYNLAGNEIFSLVALGESIIKLCDKGKLVIQNNNKKRSQVMDISKIKSELEFFPLSLHQKLEKYYQSIIT
jgi:nucleoside-diphosphate-sugar epimerase